MTHRLQRHPLHYRKCESRELESALAYFNLGQELMNQGKESDAITAYRKAIELDPQIARTYTSHGQALSNKAWRLANQPNWNHGDAKRAVEFGRLAVQFTPESAGAWQHLGWVEYRGRNWSASIEALEKSCKLQEGGMGDAFQWLFLAMAHWQLGDTESARKWYDKAIEFEKVWPAELHRFRAEAEELLGVDEKKK